MTLVHDTTEVEALRARVAELTAECDQIRAFWLKEYEALHLLWRLAVHEVKELREKK